MKLVGQGAAATALLVAFALRVSARDDAELRVVEHLRGALDRGERIEVSRLVAEVFIAPEERGAVERLVAALFSLPLRVVQIVEATGRPPSLVQLEEQLGLTAPGTAEVLVRILEADPRVPRFLQRDPGSGAIVAVDAAAVRAHPRFGRQTERTLTGWEGRSLPDFSVPLVGGGTLDASGLRGRPYVLYFWFSHCPPCVRTTPMLAELARKQAGLMLVAVNADVLLGVAETDAGRAAYLAGSGPRLVPAVLTAEAQAQLGEIAVYPTLLFVDPAGRVVRQLVGAPDDATLEAAALLALAPDRQ